MLKNGKSKGILLAALFLFVLFIFLSPVGLTINAVLNETFDADDKATIAKSAKVKVMDVSSMMDKPLDSVFVDAKEVAVIRQSYAYTKTLESLGNMGLYGTQCRSSYTCQNTQSYIFGVVNTDLSFGVDVYTKEDLEKEGINPEVDMTDNGYLWTDCYEESVGAYIVTDEVKNTVHVNASWIRFDKGIPTNNSRIYKAVVMAGVKGKFFTDYEREGVYPSTINLYDLDTCELLYTIKFESEEED